MASQKLTTIWHLIKPNRSLAAKMKLMLIIRRYYKELATQVDLQSVKLGEQKTLEAVRSVIDVKIEENANDTKSL